MDSASSRRCSCAIETLKVLVVDDDQYMRKVVRTMLLAIGVKNVYEAGDGVAGLEAIRSYMPDLVIVDWEMPHDRRRRSSCAWCARPASSRCRTCRSSC